MYEKLHKNFENFVVFFSISMKKKYQKVVGPTTVSCGFDRAEKTASDTPKQVSKKYAHSTLI